MVPVFKMGAEHNEESFLLLDLDPDDNFINQIYPGNCSFGSMYYSLDKLSDEMSQSKITVVNFNIRSFNKNFEAFQSSLVSAGVSPEILVLSETWLTEPVDMEGYSSFHCFRLGRRSGGISVFVSKSYQCCELSEFTMSNDTIETCVVKVSLGSTNLIVFAIYRPQSDSIVNFCNHLSNLLQACPTVDICLLGDLNIDLLNQESRDTLYFTSTMRSFSFLPHISKPTRFSSVATLNSATLLDHIWTRLSFNYVGNSGIILENTTDHCPTFLTFTKSQLLSTTVNDLVRVEFRLVNDSTLKKYFERISNVDWSVLNNFSDVNVAVSFFIETVNDIYCSCFPLKVRYVGRKRLSKPWLTNEILKLAKLKSASFRKYKLGLISDYECRKIRNSVNGAVRKAKISYYRYRFQECVGDMRQTWKNLRKIVSCGNPKLLVNALDIDGVTISETNEIAQIFNEHFCSVGSRICNSLPIPPLNPLSYVRRNEQCLSLDPVTSDEVGRIIASIKISKQDINSISVKLLKYSRDFLSQPISHLINMSFIYGIFPDLYKKACVTPIFKKGNALDINNYRPISILPLYSKIIEKCMARRLMSFFDLYSILSRNQFGFRKGLSTVDAVIDYSEYICNAIEERNHVIGVFIDYSKAFDTVNHTLLLSKLELYGIRDVALRLFESYLEGRSQCVKVGNVYSSDAALPTGVPQGSVLGPILFLTYINDFPNISPALKTILFADDTTVSVAGSDFVELCDHLNLEMQKIIQWSDANRLALNASKTSALVFSNRLHDVNFDHKPNLNGVDVNYVECHKFLGLNFDNKLKFRDHITFVCNKLSKSVGIMRRVSECLPQKSLIGLYYSLFYPYLTYCNVLWGGTYDVHLNTVEMLQKRVVRIITGSEYLAHTDELFYSTGILKVRDLHSYLLLLYFFRNRENFDRNTSAYMTRNSNDPVLRVHRLTLTEHSVHYAASKLWLSLPTHIKSINSYDTFKTVLKSLYVGKYNAK